MKKINSITVRGMGLFGGPKKFARYQSGTPTSSVERWWGERDIEKVDGGYTVANHFFPDDVVLSVELDHNA